MPSASDFFFFFNDTATTEIYTLSLHDALPICPQVLSISSPPARNSGVDLNILGEVIGHYQLADGRSMPYYWNRDRKSTRLNSSHLVISYAVFCLKKKKTTTFRSTPRLTTSRVI